METLHMPGWQAWGSWALDHGSGDVFLLHVLARCSTSPEISSMMRSVSSLANSFPTDKRGGPRITIGPPSIARPCTKSGRLLKWKTGRKELEWMPAHGIQYLRLLTRPQDARRGSRRERRGRRLGAGPREHTAADT